MLSLGLRLELLQLVATCCGKRCPAAAKQLLRQTSSMILLAVTQSHLATFKNELQMFKYFCLFCCLAVFLPVPRSLCASVKCTLTFEYVSSAASVSSLYPLSAYF